MSYLVNAKTCTSCGCRVMSYDFSPALEFCSPMCELEYSGLSEAEAKEFGQPSYNTNRDEES